MIENRTNDDKRYALALLGLVAAVTLLRLAALAASSFELHGDEAQYWSWSTQPAFGYYSKPPLIAWLIGMGTAVFGNTEFGVRWLAPLVHAWSSLMLGGLGWRLFGARTGFWVGLTWATLPAVWLGSAIMSTDTPLLALWSTALLLYFLALESRQWHWWSLLGLVVGLGLLAKYAMAYFLLSILLTALVDGRVRAALRHPAPVLGLALAGLLLLPNILWNLQVGFVTVGHTMDNANMGGAGNDPLALPKFLVGQLGVFGPILFLALLLSVTRGWRDLWSDPRTRQLLMFVLPPLLLMTLLSAVSRANANWAATAYPAATVLVVQALRSWERERWVRRSFALHLLAGGLAVGALPLLFASEVPLPGVVDRLPKRLRGWAPLGREVAHRLGERPGARVLTDHRMPHASLLFYSGLDPSQIRKWAPDGRVRDHYDLTAALPDVPDATIPYLLVTKDPTPRWIMNRFHTATPAGAHVATIARDRERRYLFFWLEGFRGY